MMAIRVGEFEFDLDKANEELKTTGVKNVLLQVPDGMRRKIDRFIDSLDVEVTLWGGTCYGACDLPLDIGDSEALVHIGHTEIPDLIVDYQVVYVEGGSTTFRPVPEELFDMIKGDIALYSTVQYLKQMKEVGHLIEENGYTTHTGSGDSRIKYPGQLLGCNFSTKVKKATTHLYIGTGIFHPLGLSLALKEEVLIFNPVTGDISSTSTALDRMIRKRFAAIQRIRDSSRNGIIVSLKPGQRRMDTARKMCLHCNVRCTLTEFDEIEPYLIDSFNWDGAVNTACPRLALDDSIRFEKTIVTPVEYMIAQDELDWEDWTVDEIKGSS